jgi:hypothetical protein
LRRFLHRQGKQVHRALMLQSNGFKRLFCPDAADQLLNFCISPSHTYVRQVCVCVAVLREQRDLFGFGDGCGGRAKEKGRAGAGDKSEHNKEQQSSNIYATGCSEPLCKRLLAAAAAAVANGQAADSCSSCFFSTRRNHLELPGRV